MCYKHPNEINYLLDERLPQTIIIFDDNNKLFTLYKFLIQSQFLIQSELSWMRFIVTALIFFISSFCFFQKQFYFSHRYWFLRIWYCTYDDFKGNIKVHKFYKYAGTPGSRVYDRHDKATPSYPLSRLNSPVALHS